MHIEVEAAQLGPAIRNPVGKTQILHRIKLNCTMPPPETDWDSRDHSTFGL